MEREEKKKGSGDSKQEEGAVDGGGGGRRGRENVRILCASESEGGKWEAGLRNDSAFAVCRRKTLSKFGGVDRAMPWQ